MKITVKINLSAVLGVLVMVLSFVAASLTFGHERNAYEMCIYAGTQITAAFGLFSTIYSLIPD